MFSQNANSCFLGHLWKPVSASDETESRTKLSLKLNKRIPFAYATG